MELIAIVGAWMLIAEECIEHAWSGDGAPLELLGLYEGASAVTLAALWSRFARRK